MAGKYSFEGLLEGAEVRREPLRRQLSRGVGKSAQGRVRGPRVRGKGQSRLEKMRAAFAAEDDYEEEVVPKVDTEGLTDGELANLGKELAKGHVVAPRGDDAAKKMAPLDDTPSEDDLSEAPTTIAQDEVDDDAVLAQPPPWRMRAANDEPKTERYHSVADAQAAHQDSYIASTIDSARSAFYALLADSSNNATTTLSSNSNNIQTSSSSTKAASSSSAAKKKKKHQKKKTTTTNKRE